MPRMLRSHIDTPEAFGERLYWARHVAKLSQAELASGLCTAGYISRLEAGTRIPSLHLVHALAERLRMNPECLRYGANPVDPDVPETIEQSQLRTIKYLQEKIKKLERQLAKR